MHQMPVRASAVLATVLLSAVNGLNKPVSTTWTRMWPTSFTASRFGIATDSSDNVYALGPIDNTKMSVVKYDSAGTLLWDDLLDATPHHSVNVRSAASDGLDMYAAGRVIRLSACSTSPSPSPACHFHGQSMTGSMDAFVLKYDRSGVGLHWTSLLGTTGGSTDAHGVAAGPAGNLYMVGNTGASTLAGLTAVNSGSLNGFVAMYDASSGVRQWVQLVYAEWQSTRCEAVATLSASGVYVTGDVYWFTATGTLHGNSKIGDRDTFVALYDSSSNRLWTRLIGAADCDTRAFAIATDSTGNAFFVAKVSCHDGQNPCSFYGQAIASAPTYHVVVGKLDSSGTTQWITVVSPDSDTIEATSVTVDSAANVYVVGHCSGSVNGESVTGSYDLLTIKIDSAGIVQWTKLLGTPGKSTYALAAALDSLGNLYSVGRTNGDLEGETLPGGASCSSQCMFTAQYTSPPTAEPTTEAPTDAPSDAPTNAPTTSPSDAPTLHPCNDGTHGCDTNGGQCVMSADDPSGWVCACQPGYACVAGCGAPHTGHTCELTQAPTSSPSDAPTDGPTDAPTDSLTETPQSPSKAPTESSVDALSYEPTPSPTTKSSVATAGAASASIVAGGVAGSAVINTALGGAGSPNALADATWVIESVQAIVLFGQMSAVSDLTEVVQLADSLRGYTLQLEPPFRASDRRSESNESFPAPEGLLEGAAVYAGGAFILAGLHAVLTRYFGLLEIHVALGFPFVEIHLMKIAFGALCIASAMVINPDKGAMLVWQLVAFGILICVITPYIIVVWYTLKTKVLEHGPACSYIDGGEQPALSLGSTMRFGSSRMPISNSHIPIDDSLLSADGEQRDIGMVDSFMEAGPSVTMEMLDHATARLRQTSSEEEGQMRTAGEWESESVEEETQLLTSAGHESTENDSSPREGTGTSSGVEHTDQLSEEGHCLEVANQLSDEGTPMFGWRAKLPITVQNRSMPQSKPRVSGGMRGIGKYGSWQGGQAQIEAETEFMSLLHDIDRYLHLFGPPHDCNEDNRTDKMDDAVRDEYVFRLHSESDHDCQFEESDLADELIRLCASVWRIPSTAVKLGRTTASDLCTDVGTISLLLPMERRDSFDVDTFRIQTIRDAWKVVLTDSPFASNEEYYAQALPLLLDLDRIYQRMKSDNLFLGNPFTWCFGCCNPNPEVELARLVPQLAEIECSATSHFGSDLLDRILQRCSVLKTKRFEATTFLAVIGPWFRRFRLKDKWHELLSLVMVLLLSLCVGILQPHPKFQVNAVVVLCITMLCYTLWRSPFNERMRGLAEGASLFLFTSAACLISLSQNMHLGFDVGRTVVILNLASVAVKLLYHVAHVVPFYKRLLWRKCRSHRPLVDHE